MLATAKSRTLHVCLGTQRGLFETGGGVVGVVGGGGGVVGGGGGVVGWNQAIIESGEPA